MPGLHLADADSVLLDIGTGYYLQVGFSSMSSYLKH